MFSYSHLLTNSFHSVKQQSRAMKVVVEKVLADNYMYYVVNDHKEAYVVDLGDASKIGEVEKREDFEVKAALITHHHWDHSAGAVDFAKEKPKAEIYGQDKARIPNLTTEVTDKQIIQWGDIAIQCFSTPGHTTSHVCYYLQDSKNNQKALFTGDTLFLSGCGKFFECKASVMFNTLNRLLEVVDDETNMYFGHEYSVTNLKFAKQVDPHNKSVSEKLDECKQLLGANKPTCPSKWSEEKLYNPFLRVTKSAIKESMEATDPIDVLEKLREAKDNFKG
ncbi:Hydroxyacylglutathione hydrolase-like protein [Aphelenchoides bicaudatus]|nr:Hydroxyacylglutathione hydrolase-like protein [Aphelenchoides bicaudatus]